ncbi:MAG: hypothetical protein M3011_12960 [Actinomycetota bacterium]|nr:hypothetical protein [Actinomycetota bacterium]
MDPAADSGAELISSATVISPFDVALADNTAQATAIVVAPPPPPIVGSLAATGTSRWPALPAGLALMAVAMVGLAMTRRSRSG